MNENRYFRIKNYSREFCLECFKYSGDKNTKKIQDILNAMISLIKNSNGNAKEQFFVSAEKGARAAFLEHALSRVNQGQSVSEGVVSEDEFQNFLNTIEIQWDDDQTVHIIRELFFRLVTEVSNASLEMNISSLMSFNKISDVNNKREEQIKLDFAEINSQIAEINAGVSGYEVKINNLSDNLEKKKTENLKQFRDFKIEIKNTEKKMYESNITILGIFSAVVLVFNASVSFYSSAINAIALSNSYKLFMVLLVIGIIVIGAVMGLFYYLEKIRMSANPLVYKQTPSDLSTDKKSVAYFLKRTIDRFNKSTIKDTLYLFRIVFTILLIGIISVFVLWLCGAVEKRNNRISKEITTSEIASTDTIIENTAGSPILFDEYVSNTYSSN